MASRATISFLRSLHQKKFRLQENTFLVEGPRLVEEALNSEYTVMKIFSTAQWLAPSVGNLPETEILTQKELEQVSTLHTPNKVLAVVTIPDLKPLIKSPSEGLHLM